MCVRVIVSECACVRIWAGAYACVRVYVHAIMCVCDCACMRVYALWRANNLHSNKNHNSRKNLSPTLFKVEKTEISN